jgi:predicted nucleic acid-binding protein
MIPKSILDTDILSEYLKGHDPLVVGSAARYAKEHGVFTITSMTVHEIVFGLELKGAQSQLRKVMAWFNQNDLITPVADDFISAATIRATARKQGSILELPDCLIAGSGSPGTTGCDRACPTAVSLSIPD